MSQVLPPALQAVIEDLGRLPGVGPRTAERYAYYLLRRPPADAQKIASSIAKLHNNIRYCPKTYALIDAKDEFSPLYTDPKRDKTTVAVVADPFDIVALEKIGLFHGTYHVLGGLISPLEGMTPEQLHIDELMARIDEDNVRELIMATNASVEGESTALYIAGQLEGKDVSITRLARGLPIGIDLEYADQITLGRAYEGRQQLS
jgi:recombination protein RecR